MNNQNVIAIGESDFDREVARSPVPVLADFWAPWCGPCRLLSPLMDEIAADYADKIKVVKVNVDENPQLAAQFNVRGIPTLLFFTTGGVVADQIVGAVAKKIITNKLNSVLSA